MPENASNSSNASSRFESVLAEIIRTEEEGRSIDVEHYCRSFPEIAEQLRDYFRNRSHFAHKARATAPMASACAEETALPDLAPGSQFAGYEIVREMGRGGMGVVYLARQQKANRLVALKLIRKDRLEHLSSEQRKQWMTRFCTEAKAAARIDHERVVTVYEVGAHGGHPFYSMRYVEGRSLAEDIEDGPLPNRKAAKLMEQVARAVQAVHDHKVLHRDLKPHNILVDAHVRPYVTDFGLAKCVDATESLTQTGEMLGSAAYMSPEQAQDSAKVTEATDVYGLGATLYALLTGQPPFSGKTIAETLDQVKNREPVPPRRLNSAVDRDLNTITLRCLEKEPERRPRSAAALADAFQFYLEGRPIPYRPVGPWERLWRWCRRKPALAIVSAAALVLITIAGSLYLAYSNASSSASKAAVAAANQSRQDKDWANREKERANREKYGTQMNLVQREYEANHLARVQELLAEQVPRERGTTDYRGFEWYYWDRLTHRDLLTLKAPSGAVRHVVFSLDGNQLASVGGGQVQIWNPASGQVLVTHKGGALSPDGRWLATGEIGDTVRVWDAATGQGLRTFSGDLRGLVSGPASRVAFSPDSKRLVSWGQFMVDATLRVWDVDTGRRVLSLRWPSSRLRQGGISRESGSPAFSPDSKRLAWADWDTTVRIWDVANGRELSSLKGHEEGVCGLPEHETVFRVCNPAVWGVAFSPDGQWLASAGNDATVRVWDLSRRRQPLIFTGHTGSILGVAFSPDGKRVASAGKDATMRVWDAATVRHLDTFQGHTGPVWSVVFSPDGRRLATASADTTVRIWNAVTEPVPLILKGHTGWVRSLAFSPDGKRLASAGQDPTVRVWDVASGREEFALKGSTGPVLGLAFSPDGRRLTSAKVENVAGYSPTILFNPDGRGLTSRAGQDPAVRIWDVANGKELRTLPADLRDLFMTGRAARVQEKPIPPGWASRDLDAAFSPDGSWLAWFDRSVHVCDASNGRHLLLVPGHYRAACVAFSPDGSRLASGDAELPTVRVWDAVSGHKLLTLKGHTGRFSDRLGPIDNLQKIPDPFQCKGLVWGVAFSPDGSRLASAGEDATVRVWDVGTGEELLTLKGHAGAVLGVAFSPDGRRLASAGQDQTVRIWDATGGHELLTLKGHANRVRGVAFSPDGRRLASASEDATVRVW